jgi:hypothetical protein
MRQLLRDAQQLSLLLLFCGRHQPVVTVRSASSAASAGGGDYGDWRADALGLPVFSYTFDQVTNSSSGTAYTPSAADPWSSIHWGELPLSTANTIRAHSEHIFQLGNSRLVVLASNFGAVLKTDDVQTSDMLEFHVNPAVGDNGNPGTEDHPLRSLTAARDSVRAMRAAHGDAMFCGAKVWLHTGTHSVLHLDAELDSGTPTFPIRYGAAPGANASISGGVEVPRESWRPWASHPHILTADLTVLGLSDFGALPTQGGRVDGWCDQLSARGNKTQLFHTAGSMTLARYPNIDADSSYHFLNAASGSSIETNSSFSMHSGPTAKRMVGWLAEEAPYLHGYWQADYADQIVSFVGAVTLPNGTVAMQTGVKPGVSGAGDCKTNARFWGLNLLSELDSPREYFITKSGTIYYWPELPISMWSAVPVVSSVGIGVKLDETSHVTLDSVMVRHAKGTGISAIGVTSVSVTNCTVHGIGGDGVTIFQALKSGISNSRIFDVGCTGVHVTGGNFTTLEPGLNWATGNRIHNMSRYKRTQQPGLQWSGVSEYNNAWSIVCLPVCLRLELTERYCLSSS